MRVKESCWKKWYCSKATQDVGSDGSFTCKEVFAAPLKIEIRKGDKTGLKEDVHWKQGGGEEDREGAWCTKGAHNRLELLLGSGLHRAGFFTQA